MRKAKKPITSESLLRQIEDEFRRWDHIRLHGCNDPGWEDGVNMNLVRNHIIYYYRKLPELMDGLQMYLFSEVGFEPERYGMRSIPPKYPANWMCPTGDYPNRLVGKRM